MKKDRYCMFAKHLYFGERVKHPEAVMQKLTHGAGQVSVYLLAEAPENRDRLAIIHAGYLTQSYYATHPLRVYGIAEGYSEASALLVRISDEALDAGYAGDLKGYLDAKEAGE